MTMITDYDPIAEQYRLSKQQPWRSYIESCSLLALIGDPTGLQVLDLACGEGFYSRLLRQRGAARLLGVDLSAGMIELARQQEAVHRLGVGAVLDAGLQAGNAGEAGKQDGVRAAGLLVPGAPHNLQGWRQEAQVCEATAAPCWQRPGQRLTRQ